YRARRELHGRASAEVLPAVAAWVAGLNAQDPEYDRLRTEALWIQQSHHQLDTALLQSVLACQTADARAAAVRIVADERDSIADASAMLATAAKDQHPRVRTEAARGLSFYPTPQAAEALLRMADFPEDYWVDYTLQHALGANESVWRSSFLAGRFGDLNPRAGVIVQRLIAASEAGAAALPHIQSLLSQTPKPEEERNKAMTALADLKGDVNRGREVFVRSCTACHKVGNGD
ncbi:MAG: HEAT repeat domain-containing protein, partial [Planctomyces sp.]